MTTTLTTTLSARDIRVALSVELFRRRNDYSISNMDNDTLSAAHEVLGQHNTVIQCGSERETSLWREEFRLRKLSVTELVAEIQVCAASWA